MLLKLLFNIYLIINLRNGKFKYSSDSLKYYIALLKDKYFFWYKIYVRAKLR